MTEKTLNTRLQDKWSGKRGGWQHQANLEQQKRCRIMWDTIWQRCVMLVTWPVLTIHSILSLPLSWKSLWSSKRRTILVWFNDNLLPFLQNDFFQVHISFLKRLLLSCLFLYRLNSSSQGVSSQWMYTGHPNSSLESPSVPSSLDSKSFFLFPSSSYYSGQSIMEMREEMHLWWWQCHDLLFSIPDLLLVATSLVLRHVMYWSHFVW